MLDVVMNVLREIPAALGAEDLISVRQIAEHAGFLEKIVRLLPAQAEMALVRLKAEDIEPDKRAFPHSHLQLSG